METYFQIGLLLGAKTFYLVLSNQPVIDTIKIVNIKNKILSKASYDFSNLHTNTPNNKLKNVMTEFINFSFKGGEK